MSDVKCVTGEVRRSRRRARTTSRRLRFEVMVEYEVERALRDAVGATIYSGTSEMQRNIIARWLGL
jgi:hypothetical protein